MLGKFFTAALISIQLVAIQSQAFTQTTYSDGNSDPESYGGGYYLQTDTRREPATVTFDKNGNGTVTQWRDPVVTSGTVHRNDGYREVYTRGSNNQQCQRNYDSDGNQVGESYGDCD